MQPIPVLLPGKMCDARLWTPEVRDALPSAVDADLTLDESIVAMATRALASFAGHMLPVGFSMGAIVAVEMAVQAPVELAATLTHWLIDNEEDFAR